MEIQKIGSMMKITTDGHLINEAARENIRGKWNDAVEATIQVCKII